MSQMFDRYKLHCPLVDETQCHLCISSYHLCSTNTLNVHGLFQKSLFLMSVLDFDHVIQDCKRRGSELFDFSCNISEILAHVRLRGSNKELKSQLSKSQPKN